MNMKKSIIFILILFTSYAEAGQKCGMTSPSLNAVQKASELAINLKEALDNSEGKLAIIARSGSDLSKYNLSYSHAAIVWKPGNDSQWTITHLLHNCGDPNSNLFDQGCFNGTFAK